MSIDSYLLTIYSRINSIWKYPNAGYIAFYLLVIIVIHEWLFQYPIRHIFKFSVVFVIFKKNHYFFCLFVVNGYVSIVFFRRLVNNTLSFHKIKL